MRRITIPLLTLAVLVSALATAVPAFAESPSWALEFTSTPTHLPPGGKGQIVVKAADVGDQFLSGIHAPVTITDKLPAGMTATKIHGAFPVPALNNERGVITCASLPATT